MHQMQFGRTAPLNDYGSWTDQDRHWDEEKVGDWLKRINCAQYVELFRRT